MTRTSTGPASTTKGGRPWRGVTSHSTRPLSSRTSTPCASSPLRRTDESGPTSTVDSPNSTWDPFAAVSTRVAAAREAGGWTSVRHATAPSMAARAPASTSAPASRNRPVAGSSRRTGPLLGPSIGSESNTPRSMRAQRASLSSSTSAVFSRLGRTEITAAASLLVQRLFRRRVRRPGTVDHAPTRDPPAADLAQPPGAMPATCARCGPWSRRPWRSWLLRRSLDWTAIQHVEGERYPLGDGDPVERQPAVAPRPRGSWRARPPPGHGSAARGRPRASRSRPGALPSSGRQTPRGR